MPKYFLPVLLFSTAVVLSAAQDRITAPVDRARTVPLRGHLHPRALPQDDQGAVDPAMSIDHASLLLRPDPALAGFLASQQMPGSPDYRRWLTPEQFGARFGLSAGDLAKVVSWLESQGLKVDEVARGRNWITFSGTAAQAARTFHTQFHRYMVDGRTHFANSGEPEVPAALAAVIGGFMGLNDFPTHAVRPTPQYNLSSGGHALVPGDLATIYNISPLYAAGTDGAGQTIAIVGQTRLNLTDIHNFRTNFGLPVNDPELVLVGRDPGTNASALLEADLDVEWAGGIAPKAKIVYVYATDPFTAARYAIDQNLANILSVSFEECESYAPMAYRAVVQQANAQGITFLSASGDQGAATCDNSSPVGSASKGARATFPAGIPEVTAVGGTMFNEGVSRYWGGTPTANLSSALSYIPELPWNESVATGTLAAGGGGASAYYAKPSWQTGSGVPDDQARDTPDVSLAAAFAHDPYLVISGGNLYGVGGTSAGTPSFAGIVALLNQSLMARKVIVQPGLGNINPDLYRLAQSAKDAFHDIATGDNRVPCSQGSPDCVNGLVGFAAGPGYDLATGLGSVDAAKLIAAWDAGGQSTTTVTADPGKAGLSDTVKLTATVKGSGSAVPGGTVTFVTSLDASLGTEPLVVAGGEATASVSAPAQSVLAGDGKVYAVYSGDAVHGPSSGMVEVGVNLPATGSFVIVTATPNPTSTVAVNNGQAPLTVVLAEKAGVATKLSSVTYNGSNISLNTFFAGGTIAANGTLTSAAIGVTSANPPSDGNFHFAGQDADGTTWTRDLTVRILASPGPAVAPGMTLSSAPSVVVQNPQADASCQWSHRLTLRETGGFYVTLNDPSGSVQQMFGTTRLAPFGTLTGNVCVSSANLTAPGSKSYQFSGLSDLQVTVTASVAVSYAAQATTPATLSLSAKSVSLAAAEAGQSDSGEIDVNFAGGSPQWSVATASAKPAWLTITPASGTGAGKIAIEVSSTGLSKGVYNATLVIQSAESLPQAIYVPVMFVVGASKKTVIGGVAHGASFKQAFAPGMILSVFGTSLAPSTVIAGTLPLPLSMAGVSATVNGVSAPFYFVSPGQINLQVPYETSAGMAVLAINNNGEVAAFPFEVGVTAPGIFSNSGVLAPNSTGKAGDTLLAFVTGDGDQTPTLATGATPASTTTLSKLPKSRQTVTVTVGGVPAKVAFNGVPSGLAGVTQINFEVPGGVPAGVQDVVVTVGGVDSPAVKITVQ